MFLYFQEIQLTQADRRQHHLNFGHCPTTSKMLCHLTREKHIHTAQIPDFVKVLKKN